MTIRYLVEKEDILTMMTRCTMICGVVLLGLCGCRDKSGLSPRKNTAVTSSGSNKGTITLPGPYSSPGSEYQLMITLGPADTIVRYTVHHTGTGVKVVDSDAGSDSSRWYFVWGHDDTLWVYSGDIGSSVWVPADGAWSRHNLTLDSPFLKRVPAAFYANMSPGTKKWYGSRIKVVTPATQSASGEESGSGE